MALWHTPRLQAAGCYSYKGLTRRRDNNNGEVLRVDKSYMRLGLRVYCMQRTARATVEGDMKRAFLFASLSSLGVS